MVIGRWVAMPGMNDHGHAKWRWRIEEDADTMTQCLMRWRRRRTRHSRYCRRLAGSARPLEAAPGRRGTVTVGPCPRPCRVTAGSDDDVRHRLSPTGTRRPPSMWDRGRCRTCVSMTSWTDMLCRGRDVITGQRSTQVRWMTRHPLLSVCVVTSLNLMIGLHWCFVAYNGELKPRLHQIHVAGFKYPGRATCIRLHVDGYKF